MKFLLAFLAFLGSCASPGDWAELPPDEFRISYGEGQGSEDGSWVEAGVAWSLGEDAAALEVRALRAELAGAKVTTPLESEPIELLPSTALVPAQSPAEAGENRLKKLSAILLLLLGGSTQVPWARDLARRKKTGAP